MMCFGVNNSHPGNIYWSFSQSTRTGTSYPPHSSEILMDIKLNKITLIFREQELGPGSCLCKLTQYSGPEPVQCNNQFSLSFGMVIRRLLIRAKQVGQGPVRGPIKITKVNSSLKRKCRLKPYDSIITSTTAERIRRN